MRVFARNEMIADQSHASVKMDLPFSLFLYGVSELSYMSGETLL